MAKENPTPKSRSILAIALIVFELAGIGVSIYLTWIKLHLGENFKCDISAAINCSAVAASEYSAILGMPIAYLGTLTYIVCVALTILGLKPEKSRFHAHAPNYLFAISIWCVIYSIFLAVISTFVIRAVCTYCICLYVVNIGLFVCSFIWSGDVPDGRFKPLLLDAKDGVKTPQVWGGVIAVVILLVVSGFVFAKIKPPPRQLGDGKFDLRGHPFKGNLGAPVIVVEVSDPKCPWCAKANRVIQQAETAYGDKFQVSFVFYPLEQECNEKLKRTVHPQACIGSYAARCAQLQGEAKFWEYINMLFERQTEDWTADQLVSYAREINLDTDKFRQCLADPDTVKYVKSDIKQCEANNISSTPAIFFNGKEYGGITTGVPAFLDDLQEAMTAKPTAATAPSTSEKTIVPQK